MQTNTLVAQHSPPKTTESTSWDLIEVSPMIDWHDLRAIIRKRMKWLIGLPALLIAAALVYLFFIAVPVYKSTALVFIDPKFDHILQVEEVNSVASDLDSLNSLERAMVSDSMIIRVVDKLDLRNDITFLPKSLRKKVAKGEPISDSLLLKELRKKFASATLIRPTRLIELAVYDFQPERAQKIASAFVEEFESFLGQQKMSEAGHSSTELRRQSEIAYERALEAENGLKEFRVEHPSLTVEQDHQLFADRLTKLGDELNAISGRVLDLQSQVETLESIDPEKDPIKVIEVGRFSAIDHVSDLLSQRLNARSGLAIASERFTESSPNYRESVIRVADVEAQLTQLATDLKSSVNASYEAAATNEKLLNARVEELQMEMAEVKSKSSEFRAIQQKVETEWQVFESLQQKIGQTSLITEKSTSITTVMSEPIVPHKPAKPSKPLTVLIAGFLGGILGFGIVSFDLLASGSFVNRRQIENYHQLPVAAEIRTAESESELVKEMTKVLVSEGHRESKFIHFTSVDENREGLRLAASLASASAYYGVPTLLISVVEGGSPNALVNLAPKQSQRENLHTLPIPESFLISQTSAWQLLSPHCQEFGRIVIDSTGISQESQIPAVISRFTNSTLIVVQMSQDSKRDVEETVRNLGQDRASSTSLILQS